MCRQKEFDRKNRRCEKYKEGLAKLLDTIKYERTCIRKKLDDYYNEKIERLDKAIFKKKLASFHNKVNYSRFLLKKINRF